MNSGKMVFSQITDHLPLHNFHACVRRYRGQFKVRSFSCLDQYLCMAFAQMTFRESLRDIEACLRAQQSKLYHMGIRGHVSRTTLADANEKRDWRIYADFAQALIEIARALYAKDDFGLELAETVYALDSTTIDLCLSVFPWAPFHHSKAAVKVHTLLDLRGGIPSFVHITHGRWHDAKVLDVIIPEAGAFYVMDRGYIHFKRLRLLNLAAAFFVIRAHKKFRFRRIGSRQVDKSTGLRCDQTVITAGVQTAADYPEKLRRIKFYDCETGRHFVFLTNNFTLPPLTIAQLYKARWRVELFFKWIKQHLRIKRFFGTSENAVKTQIWIAVSVYLLVAIIKKRHRLDPSLYTILQVLSITAFEKIPIDQIFSDPQCTKASLDHSNQLILL